VENLQLRQQKCDDSKHRKLNKGQILTELICEEQILAFKLMGPSQEKSASPEVTSVCYNQKE